MAAIRLHDGHAGHLVHGNTEGGTVVADGHTDDIKGTKRTAARPRGAGSSRCVRRTRPERRGWSRQTVQTGLSAQPGCCRDIAFLGLWQAVTLPAEVGAHGEPRENAQPVFEQLPLLRRIAGCWAFALRWLPLVRNKRSIRFTRTCRDALVAPASHGHLQRSVSACDREGRDAMSRAGVHRRCEEARVSVL